MTGKKIANEKLGVMTIGFSPVVREGLQAIMAKDENISIIGDARDGDEAVRNIKKAQDRGMVVNVVLTETRNGKVDGVQATRLVRDEFPEIAVLVLTESNKATTTHMLSTRFTPVPGDISSLRI
jgi:DNA-binding NarL/FixJ family response regulator